MRTLFYSAIILMLAACTPAQQGNLHNSDTQNSDVASNNSTSSNIQKNKDNQQIGENQEIAVVNYSEDEMAKLIKESLGEFCGRVSTGVLPTNYEMNNAVCALVLSSFRLQTFDNVRTNSTIYKGNYYSSPQLTRSRLDEWVNAGIIFYDYKESNGTFYFQRKYDPRDEVPFAEFDNYSEFILAYMDRLSVLNVYDDKSVSNRKITVDFMIIFKPTLAGNFMIGSDMTRYNKRGTAYFEEKAQNAIRVKNLIIN